MRESDHTLSGARTDRPEPSSHTTHTVRLFLFLAIINPKHTHGYSRLRKKRACDCANVAACREYARYVCMKHVSTWLAQPLVAERRSQQTRPQPSQVSQQV